MKRIFLSLLMCVAAGITFAQTPEEKAALKAAEKEAKTQVAQGIKLRDEIDLLYNASQAELAKGDKAKLDLVAKNSQQINEKAIEANKLLTTALESGNIVAKKRFDPCRALDNVSTHLINSQLALAKQNEPFDTLLFAKAVDGVCTGCYGQIEYGNIKDYEQGPMVKEAYAKMPRLMVNYAYLCIFYAQGKNLEGAIDAYDKYVNFDKNYPKVATEDMRKNPPYPFAPLASNIYYIAYTQQRYDVCEKYYEQALQYDDEDNRKFVVSSHSQIYLAQGDTAKWVKSVEDMLFNDPTGPNAEIATQNLLAYYIKKSNKAMGDFADKVLADNPNNKMANYGKGHSLFFDEKYDEAFTYFQKTIELDPDFADGQNMCGMSLYRQAGDNYFKYIDKKKFKTSAELSAAEEKYVMSLYRQAVPYFETCRTLAPDESGQWAGPLQTIYRNLGEKAKAAELDVYMK
ncbi:MAG: hypothetical protein J6Y39_07235 [Bacteroidaceae bacterium]|nr:hypothetical protein [Bacteroidaceae bacterium]